MGEPASESEETGSEASPPSMPRWVKVAVLVVLVLVAGLVIIMLVAGGEHGPGLHTGAAEAARISILSGGRDPL